jgi:5-formyltetrahydrofolate cyclo-ligase
MTGVSTKQGLRAAVGERVAALSGARRLECDRRIVALVAADRRFLEATTVLGYSALADETCVDELWSIAVDRGKRVLLPKTSQGGELSFAPWSENAALERGAFGVDEPPAPPEEPMGACVILVPGRAFDSSGMRLGRGGGHYDRVLKNLRKSGPAIGVAYHCQLMEQIPGLPHDVPVDDIVTERGFVLT